MSKDESAKMIDCLILGDSIALGTHQFKTQCYSYVKSGINSSQFNTTYVNKRKNDFGSEVVIVSLGSNDAYVKTYNELYKLRERIKAQRVYWILPNPDVFPKQAEDVKLISVSFGDTVISTKRYSQDKVHPTTDGYKELAEQAK